MFSMPVDRIIYAYSEHQPMFEEMKQTIPNLSLHQGSYQDKFLFSKQPTNLRLDPISVTYMFAWNLHRTESIS